MFIYISMFVNMFKINLKKKKKRKSVSIYLRVLEK